MWVCACVSVRVWKREGEGGTRKINLDYPHHCHRCSSDFVLILLRFSLWQPHTHPHAHAYTQSLTHTHTHTLSFFLPLGSPQTWMTIQLKAKTLIKGLIFFTHLKKLRPLRLKKLSKKIITSHTKNNFESLKLSQLQK